MMVLEPRHDPASGPIGVPAAARVAEALARFCRADGNDWGADLNATTLREVQRPFSRLHWCRVTGAGVAADIVVKAARGSSRAARGAAIAEAAAAHRLDTVFAAHPTLGVIAPLRTYPELLAVITPAVSAHSLAVLIEKQGAWWPSADTRRFLKHGCALAGQWLRRLHVASPAAAPWTLDTLREDLALRVRLLQEFPRAYGLSGALAGRILRWLDVQLSHGPAADLLCSETHRDYSPSNMLYDGRRLRVLDFGTLREAPRLLDATRFLHQVQMLSAKPQYRPGTRRALQDAFAAGYDDEALLSSPLVPVFMARHELSHWLGAARRVRRGRRSSTSVFVCLMHARALRRMTASGTTAPPR